MTTNFQFLSRLVPISLLVLGFFWLVFGVVQTEILTRVYKDEIAMDKICEKLDSKDFKYGKIIAYENYKKSAQIYCIFKNPNQNLRVFLTKDNDTWKTWVFEPLNKKNSLYWPIYL